MLCPSQLLVFDWCIALKVASACCMRLLHARTGNTMHGKGIKLCCAGIIAFSAGSMTFKVMLSQHICHLMPPPPSPNEPLLPSPHHHTPSPLVPGLDVYEDEPAMKPGLAELPNIVIVPHIASASMWTRSGMVSTVLCT